jgi:hypothetical protein
MTIVDASKFRYSPKKSTEAAVAGSGTFQEPREGLKKESTRAKTTLSDAFLKATWLDLNNVPPKEVLPKDYPPDTQDALVNGVSRRFSLKMLSLWKNFRY